MELYELEWNWVYVFILFTYVLFVCTVSFDMIDNWSDKKSKDTRILIIGSGVFGLGLLVLATNNKVALLTGIVFLVTVLSGLIAVDDRFGTSTKPWELYLMAITSLVALFVITGYVYYKSGAKEYIQEKSQVVRQKMSDYRAKRRLKSRQDDNNLLDLLK